MKVSEMNKNIEKLVAIQGALRVLGIDGNTLFTAIKTDIARGLLVAARARLNFVDGIVKTKSNNKRGYDDER